MLVAATRRTITVPCVPLPVATLSIAKSNDPVTGALDTPDRIAEGPAFAPAILISPDEPLIENSAALPFNVQEPPTSAEPKPFAMVRAKASVATATGAAGSMTVTDLVTAPVAPSSSVTVSVTGNVPPAE